MTQKAIDMELIKKSQWYPSKNLYTRGIQNSRYQNKNLVIFNINHNNKIIEGTLTQTMSLITILIIIAIITIIRLHHTVIDPTNKIVILNDWKVKFKIM